MAAGFDSGILSAKMVGHVKLNGRVADFRAEQVILVRDDTAKDRPTNDGHTFRWLDFHACVSFVVQRFVGRYCQPHMADCNTLTSFW